MRGEYFMILLFAEGITGNSRPTATNKFPKMLLLFLIRGNEFRECSTNFELSLPGRFLNEVLIKKSFNLGHLIDQKHMINHSSY